MNRRSASPSDRTTIVTMIRLDLNDIIVDVPLLFNLPLIRLPIVDRTGESTLVRMAVTNSSGTIHPPVIPTAPSPSH